MVRGKGEVVLHPAQSTSYLLVVESPQGVVAREASVDVTGTRGSGDFPDRDDFNTPFVYRLTDASLPSFLTHLRDVLQNQLHYSLRAYDEDAGSVIATDCLERRDLVRSKETNIGSRRLAYQITVKRRKTVTDSLEFTVETFVQYRLLRERTWRSETDRSFREETARVLVDTLRRAAARSAGGS